MKQIYVFGLLATSAVIAGGIILSSPDHTPKDIKLANTKVTQPAVKQVDTSLVPETPPSAPIVATEPISTPTKPADPVPAPSRTPLQQWWDNLKTTRSEEEASCMVSIAVNRNYPNPVGAVPIQTIQDQEDYAINKYGSICAAVQRLPYPSY